MVKKIYKGETECQHEFCKKKAYYIVNFPVHFGNSVIRDNEKYLCGHHSKKYTSSENMPKNNKKYEKPKDEYKDHNDKCTIIAEENKKKGIKGKVSFFKMRMFSVVGYQEGYLNIFPNYKHGNRSGGIGCSSLSPMSVGPVVHNQPTIKVNSKNLENFHQGNKVFEDEVDKDGNIKDKFFKTQLAFYNDNTPHRHKPNKSKTNKTLFSVWVTQDKKLNKLTSIESRQFYCNYYERLVKNLKEFTFLQNKINEGYNLRICGYDANDVTTYEEAYLDGSKPFGHERVLACMLELKEEDYPWRKYKTFDF